jgi:hypothetical protein
LHGPEVCGEVNTPQASREDFSRGGGGKGSGGRWAREQLSEGS